MQKNTSSLSDHYAQCLESLLKFYDTNCDFIGLVHALPRAPGPLTKEDVYALGEKLHYEVEERQIEYSQIPSLDMPVILSLNEGSCVYYPHTKGTQAKFFIPSDLRDTMTDDFTPEKIAELYTGSVIIFIPEDKNVNIDTSHMYKSHALDWFWKPITNFWKNYSEVILCSLFINLLGLAVPLYSMNVYDRVVINFVPDTLLVLTSGIILATLFDFMFKAMRSHILENISSKISAQFDVDLMERFVSIRETDIHLSVGEKSNLFRELHGIRDFYASRLVPTLVDVPFIVFFIIVIYMIAPGLSAIPVIITILILLMNFFAKMPLERSTEQYFKSMQNKTSSLIEMLNGISTIKSMNAKGYKLFKWKQLSQSSATVTKYNSFVTQMVTSLSMTANQLGYIMTIFCGVYIIHDGNLTTGGLVACTIIYSRAVAPAVGLSTVLSKLKQCNDVLLTIDKIFQLPHEDERDADKDAKGPFKGHMELRDVKFQYPGQAKMALNNINLNIQAGQKVGLIGRTGAGKSTMGKLLAGILNPAEGSMLLDGFSYSAIAESELRRSIGYVPQDPFFFRGTIRENIIMGDSLIDKTALERALHYSGLDLVIQQTGEGLDMNVGEAGSRLSGGQKQAIVLARAIARDPEIMIFDEPTTGMDSALEERMRLAMQEYVKNKTFIMITHRTTLLPLVERIVFIDSGRIMADGPRDEVLKKISNG